MVLPGLPFSWPSFPASGLLHDTSGPLEDPLLPYLADAWHMNHKAGDCQWDAQTKEVLFEGVGPVPLMSRSRSSISPSLRQDGQDFTVTIVGLFASLSWDDFYTKTENAGVGATVNFGPSRNSSGRRQYSNCPQVRAVYMG